MTTQQNPYPINLSQRRKNRELDDLDTVSKLVLLYNEIMRPPPAAVSSITTTRSSNSDLLLEDMSQRVEDASSVKNSEPFDSHENNIIEGNGVIGGDISSASSPIPYRLPACATSRSSLNFAKTPTLRKIKHLCSFLLGER